MKVISGSHRNCLIPHGTSKKKGNLLGHNQEVHEIHLDKENTVDLCLNAGQISIHDGLILHSSNPNRSKRRRCGLTVRFIPNNIFHNKHGSLHEFQKEAGKWTVNKL